MKQAYTMLGIAGLLLANSLSVVAQEEIKAVPVVTGYTGSIFTFEPGNQTLNPILTTIFLVPLGKRALIEAEFEIESEFEREDGEWGPRTLEKEIEYLQLDYLAHRYLTVVAGRFLTPFGIFNERLHPIWIKNLQPTPLIFAMEHGSGNGVMLRGGSRLGSNVNVNYAGYFSALSTVETLESERSTGGRWSLFFPDQRFEAGFSFNRRLGQERFNLYGFDTSWNLQAVPLDLRAEYARGGLGSGYWIEGAYRLIRVSGWDAFFRRSQIVVRVEQFFAPADAQHEEEHEEEESMETEEDHHSVLPEHDTQRVFLGWNFYIREGLKLSFAHGRSFTSEKDHNIWSIGLTYRFLF